MLSIAFLDNDIILKLIACDLFEEGIKALGVNQEQIRVLAVARFYFQKSRKIRQSYSEEICNKAVQLVSQCQRIQGDAVDPDELSLLQSIEGIDPGEAVLIAGTKNETDFYFISGDKRCLKALGWGKNLDAIRERLRGKGICLEQIILRLIEVKGFDFVFSKVLPARGYDTALRAIFGSGERATQDNVIMSLRGYIRALQEESNGLLMLDR